MSRVLLGVRRAQGAVHRLLDRCSVVQSLFARQSLSKDAVVANGRARLRRCEQGGRATHPGRICAITRTASFQLPCCCMRIPSRTVQWSARFLLRWLHLLDHCRRPQEPACWLLCDASFVLRPTCWDLGSNRSQALIQLNHPCSSFSRVRSSRSRSRSS